MPAPLDLVGALGKGGAYAVSFVIGFGFGFVLERAGFADSRRLAAQFYLHEQRVLKVMFTAIVVAMLGVFWASALQLVELERIFVNPTHLWPGIVGGIILGMGFIVGGYCPGTSLVSAATLKTDGAFFLGGVFVGVTLFGESLGSFANFWEQSGAKGRFTLFEWLGLEPGWVVVGVVLLALGMFWGAEKLEAAFAHLRRRSGMGAM